MKDLLEKLKSAKSGDIKDIKVPPVFADLYGDLRDRHLLPLVAVLLVAIAAVPFLLKASDPELSQTQAETSLPEAVPASARLEVVADVPALRDYKDRLSELVAKDPFQQHFTAPQVEGAQLGPVGSAPTTVPTYEPPPAPAMPAPDLSPPASTPTYVPPTPAPDPAPSPPPTSTGGTGNGNGGGDGGGRPEVRVETKLVSYRLTARMGEPGDMNVRRNIPELTMLPSEKNPVAVFLGVSGNGKKALVLVSSEVNETRGGVCAFRDQRGFGDEVCQMLEIEPGFPVTFTYGTEDRKFRISVRRIERVAESGRGGSERESRDAGAPTVVGASSSVD